MVIAHEGEVKLALFLSRTLEKAVQRFRNRGQFLLIRCFMKSHALLYRSLRGASSWNHKRKYFYQQHLWQVSAGAEY
jgi:hypothetical protein